MGTLIKISRIIPAAYLSGIILGFFIFHLLLMMNPQLGQLNFSLLLQVFIKMGIFYYGLIGLFVLSIVYSIFFLPHKHKDVPDFFRWDFFNKSSQRQYKNGIHVRKRPAWISGAISPVMVRNNDVDAEQAKCNHGITERKFLDKEHPGDEKNGHRRVDEPSGFPSEKHPEMWHEKVPSAWNFIKKRACDSFPVEQLREDSDETRKCK